MNIDKSKMKIAYYNRENDRSMNELVGYFYELANFFASKAKISSYYREDYVQLAVERACKKIDLFDQNHINKEGKVSAVFSYFYKLIYMEVLYRMRETKQKRDRRPSICSYEAISTIIEDQHSEQSIVALTQEYEERHILINGQIFNRTEVIEAIRKARKLLNKANRNVDFIPDTDDEVVLDFYYKLKGVHGKQKVEA